MDALLWILLPGFVAVGSGLLAFYVMQSRMDVALARERESMAEARGALQAEKIALESAVRSAQDAARREALDEFLADVHIEQRHWVRENKVRFQNRRWIVLQERVFFRNIPLSNWIKQEVMLGEGENAEEVARNMTAFVERLGIGQRESSMRKLLR